MTLPLTVWSFLAQAVVLPFCPFVEDGTKQRQPSERLNMNGGWCREGASFEAAVQRLIEQVLEVRSAPVSAHLPATAC